MSVMFQVLAVLLLAVPVLAQSPTFATISIQTARSGDPRAMRLRLLPNGDLVASGVSLPLLLQQAYGVPLNPSPRLSGVPDWLETFDIEAKAPANAIPPGLSERDRHARAQAMIRSLLADRFKLAMRVEEARRPVYALRVASSGPQLRRSTIAESACVIDTGEPDGCHNFRAGRGHPLRAATVTTADLAGYIENWTDLPVVDRTALSGLFALDTGGWNPMRLPPPPPGNAPLARYDDLPTIFMVLGSLGLELKQETSTVPVYTVEHIERPAVQRAAVIER